MAQANIDALLAEIAAIKESLRIKNQSLANINPNFQMNAAYIAKLKTEIAGLNSDLAQAQANLAAASTPTKQPQTRAVTETAVQSTPYDNDGQLNYGWYISPETGQPYYTGTSNVPDTNTVVDTGAATQAENDALTQAIADQQQAEQYAGLASQAENDALNQAIQEQQQAEQYAGLASQAENDALTQAIQEQQQAEDQVGGGITSSAENDAINKALAQAATATQGLTTSLLNTRSQATQQDQSNARQKNDWRVRLQLAPNATYLYKVAKGQAGILNPLQDTDGVIFPYTPTVTVNYAAGYEAADIAHSNYKIYSYKSSSVDNISIGCEFTAQDTYEANYMLAVIHFFRSVTKMFYGQDQNPKPGTPPPLCYLTGLGAFQFDNHPLAVTAFNYSLPNDVDYIRAGNPTAPAGVNLSPFNSPDNSGSVILRRLQNLVRGGGSAPVQFSTNTAGNYGTAEPTYVPTKMQISISAVPIITRNDISNNFSLREYATGKLLRGSTRQGGGIW
jgi:hypothetical protein